MNDFTSKVIQMVRKIPRGRVATYKQIAELCGKPHASRGVAWILNSCAKKYELPWQRVLSSKGRISFKPGTHAGRLQKSLLQREGVNVAAAGEVDLKRSQWKRFKRPKIRRGSPRLFA